MLKKEKNKVNENRGKSRKREKNGGDEVKDGTFLGGLPLGAIVELVFFQQKEGTKMKMKKDWFFFCVMVKDETMREEKRDSV